MTPVVPGGIVGIGGMAGVPNMGGAQRPQRPLPSIDPKSPVILGRDTPLYLWQPTLAAQMDPAARPIFPQRVLESVKSYLGRVRQLVTTERLVGLSNYMQNTLYWKGNIVTNYQGNVSFLSQSTGALPRVNEYNQNIVLRDGKEYLGILGKLPDMRFVPVLRGDDQLEERAEIGNRVLSQVLPFLTLSIHQLDIVKKLFLAGTVFIKVSPSCGERHGTVAYPQVQQFPNPLNGQMEPQVVNTVPIPGTTVEISARTIETIITPVENTLDRCSWLVDEYDIDAGIYVANNPWARAFLQYIKPASTTSTLSTGGDASTAAASVYARRKNSLNSNYIGGSANNWTITEAYLDPAAYYNIELGYNNDNIVSQRDSIADFLQSNYPTGAIFTYANGTLISITPSRGIRQTFVTMKSDPDASLYSAGTCTPSVQANKLMTTVLSVLVKTLTTGVPIKMYDPSVISPVAIAQSSSGMQDWIPAVSMSAAGRRLADAIHQTEPSEVNPNNNVVLSFAGNASKEVLCLRDELSGGGTTNSYLTLGEANTRLNRALAAHNPTWEMLRNGWSKALLNTVSLLLNTAIPDPMSQDYAYVLGDATFGYANVFKLPNADREQLIQGGIQIEVDENIPMTSGQVREMLAKLLTLPPDMVMTLLGLQNPANLATVQRIISIPGIVATAQDPYRKVTRNIDKLSKVRPLQMPDPMTGQLTIVPSFDGQSPAPIDVDTDDPMFTWDVIKNWTQTPAAIRLREKDPSQAGPYNNVVQYGLAYKNFFEMQQAQMQMAQMQAAGVENGAQSPAPAVDPNAPPPPPPSNQPIPDDVGSGPNGEPMIEEGGGG